MLYNNFRTLQFEGGTMIKLPPPRPRVTFHWYSRPIITWSSRLDDQELLAAWQAMQGSNPHGWYNKKRRITNEQWMESLESELSFRCIEH